MAYPISRLIISPVYRIWLGKTEGTANIPKDKPFIIAANHSSYYDTLLVPIIIIPNANKKLHAWVDSTYWNISFTKFFLNMWEGIPVYIERQKNAKEKNKQAFKKAVSYLKKGDLIMIFPEGKRNADGKLSKGYTGIAKLALESKAPVLPIGIIGANKVLPKGKSFPRFVRCEVKIGKPIHFPKYYNKKINEKSLQEVTRSIMKEIAKLSGKEYDY